MPEVIQLAAKLGSEIRLALEPILLTTKLYCLANDFTLVYSEELKRPCSVVTTRIKRTERTEVASKINGDPLWVI